MASLSSSMDEVKNRLTEFIDFATNLKSLSKFLLQLAMLSSQFKVE
jgi:hypothetical protein